MPITDGHGEGSVGEELFEVLPVEPIAFDGAIGVDPILLAECPRLERVTEPSPARAVRQ